MIDREFIELAGLDAVGCLDEAEQAEFRQEFRINPELRRATSEMRDIVAMVAATATPPADLPTNGLAGIYTRLAVVPNAPVPSLARPAGRSRRPWLPWALAAGFAVVAGWQEWRHIEAVNRGLEDRWNLSNVRGQAPTDPASPSPSADGPTGDDMEARLDGALAPSGAHAPPPPYTNVHSAPKLRLQKEIQRLRAELAAYEENGSPALGGTAARGGNLVSVLEMVPPGTKRSPEERQALSDRITEAIGSSVREAGSPADPTANPEGPGSVEAKLEGSKDDSGWNLAGSVIPSRRQLKTLIENEVPLRHTAFPQPDLWETRGIIPIGEDTAYDTRGGLLWRLAPNGIDRIPQIPPDGWSPQEFEAKGTSALWGSAMEIGNTDGLSALNPSGSAQTDWEGRAPYALPVILDQQGRGTLFVQNLPPLPDDEVYRFWMTHDSSTQPIAVTDVSPSPQALDAIPFEAPVLGASGYLLTREKKGSQSTRPSSAVLLTSSSD